MLTRKIPWSLHLVIFFLIWSAIWSFSSLSGQPSGHFHKLIQYIYLQINKRRNPSAKSGKVEQRAYFFSSFLTLKKIPLQFFLRPSYKKTRHFGSFLILGHKKAAEYSAAFYARAMRP